MSSFRALVVYSNTWVGMASAALCLMHIPELTHAGQTYPLFVLASTAAAYNYMRLVQQNKTMAYSLPGYKRWVAKHTNWVAFFTAFFSVLSLYFLWSLWSGKLLWALSIPFSISLLYPVTFKDTQNRLFSIRMWPGVKLFLIAAVWAYMIVWLPNFLYTTLEAKVYIEFFVVMLFIAGLTIPFDVRDLWTDDPAMRTLPAVLGEKKALALSRFLLAVVELYAIAAYFVHDWNVAKVVAYVLALEIAIALIKKMRSTRDEFYTSFWIEGVPVYAFLLYWLLSQLLPYL